MDSLISRIHFLAYKIELEYMLSTNTKNMHVVKFSIDHPEWFERWTKERGTTFYSDAVNHQSYQPLLDLMVCYKRLLGLKCNFDLAVYRVILHRIYRFLEYLAMLLQSLLRCMLLFSSFSEFPNRRRPPCTTMPWNIWPSLVVLWGVCWMFYTPLVGHNASRFGSYFDDDHLSPFLPEFTQQTTFSSFSAGLEFVGPGFDCPASYVDDSYASYFGQDIHNDLPLDSFQQQTFNQNPSMRLIEPHAYFEESYTSSAHSTFDVSPGSLNKIPSETSSLCRGHSPTYQSSSSTSSQLVTASIALAAPSSCTLLSSQPAESQSSNVVDKLICNHPGCGCNRSFKIPSALRTHVNKFIRPFQCTAPSCDYASARKAERDRHVRAVHKELESMRQGPTSTVSELPSIVELGTRSSAPSVGSGLSLPGMSRAPGAELMGKGKAKRNASDESGSPEIAGIGVKTMASSSTRKRVRTKELSSANPRQITQREEELTKENKRLRKELEESRAREEKSRAREEMLLDIMAELRRQGG